MIRLTQAEERVLELKARGLCDKEVAQKHRLSVLTVNKHIYNLRKKLHIPRYKQLKVWLRGKAA